MNYVDYNFKWLTHELEGKKKEEIFEHIKKQYLLLHPKIRKSIETFLNDYNYWGKLNYEDDEYEEIWNKANTFYNHLDDLKFLYNKLGDYRSKKLLFGILYNWYDYDFTVLKELMDNTYCHYFDLDLVKCDNEIFVDIGAYIGDTTIDFINSYGKNSYEKIYCYEMTPDTFNYLKNNLKDYDNIIFKCKAVSDKDGTLHINRNKISASANNISEHGQTIEAVSLDTDIKDKITMIKMDIEGEEQKAIIGMKQHILNDKPKLLISVYHNHEDVWKVPKMIEDICPGYKFYLRFYGNNIFPTEIVLFGIYSND